MTKQELRQYRAIVNQIEQLKAEKASAIKLVNQPTGMPNGNKKSDPTATAAEMLVRLDELIDVKIRELIIRRERIELALSILDERNYNIMHMHYILGKTWEEVAETVFLDVRQVYRIHGSILLALRDF